MAIEYTFATRLQLFLFIFAAELNKKMGKALKNSIISIFFVIGAAILTHAIIPYYQIFDIECEIVDNNNQNKVNSSAVNCHFLDEIIDNKVFLASNYQALTFLFFQNYIFLNIDFEIQNKTYIQLAFFVKKIFPDNLIYFESKPTRGSPA